jgi:hypothetical protein
LLITFSASGETPTAKGVTLPDAENTLDMIDAPMVSINGSIILVDGNPAGTTRAIEDSKRLQRIDELFNILKAKKEVWRQLHPGKDFPGVVVLQICRTRSLTPGSAPPTWRWAAPASTNRIPRTQARTGRSS